MKKGDVKIEMDYTLASIYWLLFLCCVAGFFLIADSRRLLVFGIVFIFGFPFFIAAFLCSPTIRTKENYLRIRYLLGVFERKIDLNQKMRIKVRANEIPFWYKDIILIFLPKKYRIQRLIEIKIQDKTRTLDGRIMTEKGFQDLLKLLGKKK